MSSPTRALLAASLLCAVAIAGAARADVYVYFSVVGTGAQFEFGDARPLPLQPPRTAMGGPIGTKSKFPPLSIPITGNPAKRVVLATGSNPAAVKIAPGLFRRVPSAAKTLASANGQVRTKFSFSGPAKTLGTVTFKKNGWRPAVSISFTGPTPNSRIFYQSTKRFGGPAQFRLGAISNGVWIHPAAMLPCKHPAFGGFDATCVAQKVAWKPANLVAAGGVMMSAGGKVTGGVVVTTPGGTTMPGTVDASITSGGKIAKSQAAAKTVGGIDDRVVSVGFPWTTGMVILSVSGPLATPQVFTITGKDSRTKMGAGTLSLVAGSLSDRKFSGTSANRAWARLTMPEPGPMVATAVALATLGVCHAIARRR
jgi:hypothetical protein